MTNVTTVLCGFGCSIVFWAPSIIIHAVSKEHFESLEVLWLSLIMPIATLAALSLLARVRGEAKLTAILTSIFIWLIGPVCMFVAASFAGGGFVITPKPWHELVNLTTKFPIYTFLMSTYDGTLVAVAIITVALIARVCCLSTSGQKTQITE